MKKLNAIQYSYKGFIIELNGCYYKHTTIMHFADSSDLEENRYMNWYDITDSDGDLIDLKDHSLVNKHMIQLQADKLYRMEINNNDDCEWLFNAKSLKSLRSAKHFIDHVLPLIALKRNFNNQEVA